MLLKESMLVERFGNNADGFESFMASILRELGREVGIPSDKILRDPRTTVGDGGRDIQVDATHSTDSITFLPKKKSYWSIKSGMNGLKVAIFNKEVREHPRVQEQLAMGNVFVWCTIQHCENDQKESLQKAACKMALKLSKVLKTKINEDQFIFHWNDTITAELRRHPAVVIYHLPEFAHLVRNVRPLTEWKEYGKTRANWVPFGDRNSVKQSIVSHMRSSLHSNVLHVVGISGIGKTRVVREACEEIERDSEYCVRVLYLDHQKHLLDDRDFENFLLRTNVNAIIVVDEVDDHGVDRITATFADARSRLRIVCIGPAKRQAARSSDTRIILSEPKDTNDVFSVIEQFDRLNISLLRRIADRSGHDLRLALLLVGILLGEEQPHLLLAGSPASLLDRIVDKFYHNSEDQRKAKNAFAAASCFLDIGRRGKHADELASVEKIFPAVSNELLSGMQLCSDIGLSAPSLNYFEVGPRALATMVFSERVWPKVKYKLDDVFNNTSDRLLRKFLERCHDCTGSMRTEVQADLAEYFRGLLSAIGVDELQDESSARIFSTWCEFDSRSGLTWLRQEIESTNREALKGFKGDSGFGSRWGGRRYIVWLCESLSRFPEHFSDCEIILWNLANNETELGIGNNSVAIWKGLFWPIGTHQSIPFPDRAKTLLSRIRNAQTDSSELLFNAIIEVLTPQMLGSIQPPEFVGGIMAPEPWMPASRKGLRDALREFGISAIKAVGAHFEGDYLDKFCVRFTDRLIPLLNLDLLTDLRELCQRVENEDAKRKIVANVRDIVASIDEHLTQKLSSTIDEQVRNWEQELSPRSLIDRIRFQTSRGYWDTVGDLGGKGNPYVSLAREIHDDWKVLPAIAEWLGSEKAISSYNLGYAVGDHVDLDSVEVDAFIRDSVFAKKTLTFCSGFLVGRANRDKGLNDSWGNLLDSIVESNPLFCIEATVNTDVTKRGLARFHRAIKPDVMPVSRCVSLFHRADWKAILSEDDFCQLLLLLKQSIERNEQGAVSVALDQVWMWSEPSKKLSQQVAKISLYFLESAVGKATRRDFYAWKSIAIICCEFYSVQVAKVAINWLTSWREIKDTISGDECNAVLTAAAMVSPEKVMNEIGKLMKSDKSYLLELHVFRGLFDVVGVSVVSEWLKVNGRKYIDKIARHLTSPEVDKEGRVIVQPMTEWFFVKFETDEKAFQSFLAGRRSGAVWSSDENVEDKKVEMEKFMVSDSRRLRDWANWEVRDAEWYANLSKEMDEDDERR